MKDILDYLREGSLWMAFVVLVGLFFTTSIKKDFERNPRQKYLPVWYSSILFVIILLNSFNLLSIQNTWVLIGVELIVFIYLYLLNTTVKVSYEFLILKKIESRLKNSEIGDNEKFYFSNKKLFISQLGKYSCGMIFLDYLSRCRDIPSSFIVMDDIDKLKLTNEEKRKYLVQQFYIYYLSGAMKFWENKYPAIEKLLNEDDKLYISSIIAYYNLDLNLSDESLNKLVALTSNSAYKELALSNIGVIAADNLQTIESSDYAYKAYHNSTKTTNGIAAPNLVYSYLQDGKIEKAQGVFEKYIQSLPRKTIEQRLQIINEKLIYCRNINDFNGIESALKNLFDEYHNAPLPKKYYLLLSLFRLSFNHQCLFEKALTELEVNIDDMFQQSFGLIQLTIREVVGIARLLNQRTPSLRISALVDKCCDKLKTVDIDEEIASLRIEEVNTKREYIRFKSSLSMAHLETVNAEQYEDELNKKFKILDELIVHDEKTGLALDLLHSLFLKLDEVTTAIGEFRHYFKIPNNSEVLKELDAESNSLILRILPIIEKADKAKMMAEYHLQLAFHYCRLNNKNEGYKHFQLFKNSNVSLLHFAYWLRDWYWKLEEAFNN